ncbi:MULTISPECIES: formimidoylglutamate deiminase [unclassified Pseudofrankia]|uniref:formimidoylglutamate deiminase n=1 Tax=unclassified Pseudofrankia TaxID=2994372 RepID=UPI0008DAF8C7|nr:MULTISPECIES: formimidoylglutamate deiminase [unclassified Pseudofrankia]MDT3439855.1 formimidoylglutamate deiminase [Pseudofrankia sp. BMG5.37]OHV48336.1 formimidoylglutamate deiminase [Pseudofrankia sp. BMG5.36]
MRWFAADAVLATGPARNVTFEAADGRFTSIRPGTEPGDAVRLPGVVLPGFANGHSHAFHRALRGRTHDGPGDFWSWRHAMYTVAGRLDPDSYLTLARATYAEMALAGITSVGEFHYLHHACGGTPYADPNAMAEALRQAATDAGIRLTLVDTCYLAGGLGSDGHTPLSGPQLRFGDGTVDAWAERVDLLRPSERMRVGVAAHSVRAVPREALPTVVSQARGRPLHVHLSEQPAENEACAGFYGCTPTALLAEAGALGHTTTAVHATHLTSGDVGLLGRSGTTVCLCPGTERDLADGIGPGGALRDAGAPLSVGSDQNASIDLFGEIRGVEEHERLTSLRRGRFGHDQLLGFLTDHAAIGWDAGRLEVGGRADLVAVRLDTPRTAGVAAERVLMAATAADVDTVVVDGRTVVTGGQHVLGDVGRLLGEAISAVWEQER